MTPTPEGRPSRPSSLTESSLLAAVGRLVVVLHFFWVSEQTGLLVVYVINAAIAYLSYLEAKRVGQVRGVGPRDPNG